MDSISYKKIDDVLGEVFNERLSQIRRHKAIPAIDWYREHLVELAAIIVGMIQELDKNGRD